MTGEQQKERWKKNIFQPIFERQKANGGVMTVEELKILVPGEGKR